MNREYISISDINRIIKFTIDNNESLRSVYIKGEISNLKFHSRGHLYFSLKDENSKINAVMFNYNRYLNILTTHREISVIAYEEQNPQMRYSYNAGSILKIAEKYSWYSH